MESEERLTFLDDFISEYGQHASEGGVDDEQEEREDGHGLLGGHHSGSLIGQLTAFRKYGEDNQHLLTHHKDDTQQKANGQGGLVLTGISKKTDNEQQWH